jgi:hypothetical protein
MMMLQSRLKGPPHPRDALLHFDAGPHKYTVGTDPGSNYTSVTTWVHRHFAPFDGTAVATKLVAKLQRLPTEEATRSPYYNQTVNQITAGWLSKGQEAAEAGTALHAAIEAFYHGTASEAAEGAYGTASEAAEGAYGTASEAALYWTAFQRFHAAVVINGDLIPYRSEWMIYNEAPHLKLAGSIDMVYEQPDGALRIYDWKRIKELKKSHPFGQTATTPELAHLPDTNFWHYALQLNVYKALLEANYDKKVAGLYLVCFFPGKSSVHVCPVPDLSAELKALGLLK